MPTRFSICNNAIIKMEINQFMLFGKKIPRWQKYLQVIAVLNQDRLTLFKLSLVNYLNMISFFTLFISDLKDDGNVL